MPVMEFAETDFRIPLFHHCCNSSDSDQQARAEYNRLIGEMLEREAHLDENMSKNHLFVQGFSLNSEESQHCGNSCRPLLHSV
mmetsp:Transcript_15362/g.51584  ORF Transcript_15362/g.51584 Transcript_15362/m.51584 type:complete len:83 (-) Transcript_15362:171-419(-)